MERQEIDRKIKETDRMITDVTAIMQSKYTQLNSI